MIDSEFTALVKRLNEYFGLQKNVTWDRHAMWFSEIKHIPAEAIPFIESCIHDNWNTLPSNLPRHMRGYYQAWKSANAQKFIDYPRTDCAECDGKGLLWVRRPAIVAGRPVDSGDGFLMQEVSYRCAKCENWMRHCHQDAKPAAVKSELLAKGFELMV